MIDSLTIKNFRLFDALDIPRLGQVNLIVGKNNSGKSSVLEALMIYASQGDPSTLFSILGSHDENLRFDNPLSGNTQEAIDSSFRHFFPSRQFPNDDGKSIYIGDAKQQSFIQLEHRLFFEVFEEFTGENGETLGRRKRSPVDKSNPELFSNDLPPEQALFLSTKQRSFWLDLADTSIARRRFRTMPTETRVIPYVHIPPNFIIADQLAAMWDRAALTDAESFLLRALRIIEPEVSGLAFVRKEESSRSREEARVAIIKLEGQSSPIPLASMGDGMTRLLQLILSLFSAKGGLLLLDEFENGLHYSVQRQAWDLVLYLAKELEVQVFATTHSHDCIDAFSSASVSDTSTDSILLHLGRSVMEGEQNQVIATLLNKEKLERLTQASIEVR
jgi:predicted ATP-dependent endonuclease of OLD family